jgi:CBS domain-containing protein
MALRDAQAVMRQHQLSQLPVIDVESRPIGLLTQGSIADTMTHLAIRTLYGRSPGYRIAVERLKVMDCITRDFVAVRPDTTLEKALELACRHHAEVLPVVSGQQLVGIITSTDLSRLAAQTPGIAMPEMVPSFPVRNALTAGDIVTVIDSRGIRLLTLERMPLPAPPRYECFIPLDVRARGEGGGGV